MHLHYFRHDCWMWVMACLPPSVRGGMRRLAVSIFLWERWPSHWIMRHVYYISPLKGKRWITRQRSHEEGVKLMIEWIGVYEDDAMKECSKKIGAHIIITWLKENYKEHLPQLLIWEIHLWGRSWWREVTASYGVSRISCYICLDVHCSLIRATTKSSWYILRRCRT